VLTVCDADGKELRVEGNGASDPTLRFVAPADGPFVVRVSERFKARGGPAFAYRLRLAPPKTTTDFRLTFTSPQPNASADALTVPRDGKSSLRINVERIGGFKEPIELTLDGLPPGVKAAKATLAANQNQVDLQLTAEKTAPIASTPATIRGVAKVDGKEVTRTAVLADPRGGLATQLDSVRVAVALPCPFKIVAGFDMRWSSRGSMYRRKYRLERNGFDGPVEIALADRQARHLQGVAGEPMIVPPGQSDFDYTVFLPPWMETGRTCRVCVQGTAIVREGNEDHAVSFSAVGQNDQIITVVETGRLDISTEKVSVLATPGATVSLPFRVSRGKALVGPARVELIVAEHMRGIATEPVTVPADGANGVLTIRFAAGAVGPLNMPAILRATVTEPSGPVVGEAKVELLPNTR
jgi:hypothetical protein